MTRAERSDLPLVGRVAELAGIRALLAGGGRGVLLAGPAGVGKSRLLREATTGERAAGRPVLTARTSGSGTGLALAALAPLLPAAGTGPDPGGGPVQLGLSALRARAAGHREGRTLLLVDDAHLLDDVSATVVHQAVAEGTVTLLAAVRTPAGTPGAVTALWKDAGVSRTELSALPAADMDALVRAVLDGPVEGLMLRRLRDVCAGNPLFLRELLISAREGGLVERSGGIWHLSGPLGAAARLSHLLRDRLATTEAAERDALELLALGEPLGVPDATALTGADLLETLERRGLVTVTSGAGPTVRLSHPMYGELLRADVPELARRRHSRRLADALQVAAAPAPGDLMRIALWRLDGGGTLDPALMAAAAEEAALVREYALAYRLAEEAYRAGRDVAAGLSAVRALFHLGRLDEALGRCTELAGVAARDDERCAVAVQHVALLVHGADDVPAASGVLDRCGVRDPGLREQLDVFRLYLRSYRLDCTVVEPARAAFRSGSSVEVRLAAAGAAGGALMLAGRFAESAALVAEAVPLAARHSGAGRTHADSMPVALAAMRCDLPDPAGAAALAEAAYEATLRPADLIGQALTTFSLARIALARGRPVTALRWATESRFAAGHLRLGGVCRWASALRLQAAVQLGAGRETAEALDDLRRHPGSSRTVRLFDMEVARALAWHAAVLGDAAGVRDALVGEVTRHGDLGAVGTGTLGALDLVRLGEPALAARLLRTYPPPDGWLLGAVTVDYATAAATRDGTALVEVARRFAGHGMPLHAAEAAMLAAAICRTAGDRRAAGRARLLADTQLAGCEEPATPALRLGGPAGDLTTREREMVLAASHGESAPAIAARLHLSERTVENHLHRAYAKLGVAGRGELRAALAITAPDGARRGR